MEGKALHPVAIIATNAQVSLNLESEDAEYCIRKFWDTPLRKGDRRYYDNCLYFFAFLALSGSYRAEVEEDESQSEKEPIQKNKVYNALPRSHFGLKPSNINIIPALNGLLILIYILYPYK